MISAEAGLKQLRNKVEAKTTLDKPAALMQEINKIVDEGGTGTNLDEFIRGNLSEVNTQLDVIPDFAFSCKSGLETVNLPNATYIGKYAFSSTITRDPCGSGSGADDSLLFNNDALKTVNMPKVTHIDKSAFERDENLEIYKLPSSLSVIGEQAFYFCLKVQITEIPDGVAIIERDAFSGCDGITSIIIPSSVIQLQAGCFYCNNLVTVDMTAFTDPDNIPEMHHDSSPFLSNTADLPEGFKILVASQEMIDSFMDTCLYRYADYFEIVTE